MEIKGEVFKKNENKGNLEIMSIKEVDVLLDEFLEFLESKNLNFVGSVSARKDFNCGILQNPRRFT